MYTEAYYGFRHRREVIKNDKTCYYGISADHKRYHLSFVVHKVRKTGIHATIIHARHRKPCTSFQKIINVILFLSFYLFIFFYYSPNKVPKMYSQTRAESENQKIFDKWCISVFIQYIILCRRKASNPSLVVLILSYCSHC